MIASKRISRLLGAHSKDGEFSGNTSAKIARWRNSAVVAVLLSQTKRLTSPYLSDRNARYRPSGDQRAFQVLLASAVSARRCCVSRSMIQIAAPWYVSGTPAVL